MAKHYISLESLNIVKISILLIYRFNPLKITWQNNPQRINVKIPGNHFPGMKRQFAILSNQNIV